MITIDGFPLDLVETIQHDLSAEVTKHPVESGSVISDHVTLNPRELTLTNAVVSNTPIGSIALEATRLIGKPAAYAYEKLESVYLAKQGVVVITGFKKYESMILDKLSAPEEHKTFGGLVFTAHFTQINIVRNRRVTVAVPNLRGLGAKKPNLGNKTSAAWGQRVGIAGSIFVISFRYERAIMIGAVKSFGQPILTDNTPPSTVYGGHGAWAHFQVTGDATPDGYVKANVYYPLSYGGSVIPKDQFGNAKQHSKIGDRPVHFDYQDQQWHDDADNTVVKVPPGGNDPWKTVTEEGPDPNAQQGGGGSDGGSDGGLSSFLGGVSRGR